MRIMDDNDRQRNCNAVVPGQCVRLEGAARVGVPGPQPDSQPALELVRDGDTIRTIDVTCTCGQHIRLRCVYAD